MSDYTLERYKDAIRKANAAMERARASGFADEKLHDLSAAIDIENTALIEYLGRTDLPEKLPAKAASIVFEITGIDPRVRRYEVVRELAKLQGSLELFEAAG